MPKFRVLLVDDEQDFLTVMGRRIESWGYEVIPVSGGKEALEVVKRDKPDLVLLDIKMKGMDGIAALKHIKDIDKKIKVVMVTALDDQDRINEACKLGACEYITKPLVLDHLEAAVEKNFTI